MDIFWKKLLFDYYLFQIERGCIFMRPKGSTKFDYSSIKEVNTNGNVVWERECPSCKKIIVHKNPIAARTCFREKRKCWSCAAWNKGLTKEANKKIRRMAEKQSKWLTKFRKTNPPWNKGLTKNDNEILKYMGERHRGHKHSDETKKMIGKYSADFWKNKEYREKVISKLKEVIGDENHINEWRLKMELGGYFTPIELKSDFEKYKQLVWFYTRKNDLSKLNNYKKRGRTNFHLDHKYSIVKGFLDNIPPEVIGSTHNLEMMYHRDNIIKNSKCSILKEDLLRLYYDGKN
jgi:hypothetical protein